MRDTIDMALDAGLAFDSDEYPDIWQLYMDVGKKEIEAFEALVRADERDEILRMSGSQWFKSQARYDEAIRARGNT
jgi:hypothetical protein